jgi:hypothetical protein
MRFFTGSSVDRGEGLEGEEIEVEGYPGSLRLRDQDRWRGGSLRLFGEGLGDAKTV